jgi:hypothetical protein
LQAAGPGTNPNPSLDLREFNGFYAGQRGGLINDAQQASGSINKGGLQHMGPSRTRSIYCSEKQITLRESGNPIFNWNFWIQLAALRSLAGMGKSI